VFRIRGEEEKPLKVVHRKTMVRAQTRLSSQELLFKLIELRIRKEVDGEAYLELLKEYAERAVKTGLDMEKLREYISRLELLGDIDTLNVLRGYEGVREGV